MRPAFPSTSACFCVLMISIGLTGCASNPSEAAGDDLKRGNVFPAHGSTATAGDFSTASVARKSYVETAAHSQSPSTQPSEDAAAWEVISAAFGRQGSLIDNVYRIVVPRDDLEVSIDSMPVPTAAGIESSFRFYRCSCGKMNVLGEFVLADYEANDVLDTLRQHQFLISSMGPLLIYDRPHLVSVRFQAEGKAPELAKTLRETLRWTGKERMAPETKTSAATGSGE